MLQSIYISNYALISELKMNFQSGMTVMTGETGAGKSIILGALGLILGQRADSKSAKNQEEKCVVEAEFDISAYPHLSYFFEENELDYDKENCLIRRELAPSGKSRAFINDTPVSLVTLKELSSQLIDIHSQHENLLLSKADYQLEVVDTVAETNDLLKSYQASYFSWKKEVKNLDKLIAEAENAKAETDFIQFQFSQLDEAQLIEDEELELEKEQESLSHVEEIKLELNRINHLLGNEEGTLAQIKESIASLSKVANYLDDGERLHERLQSSYIELKDLAQELSRMQENITFNPNRLEFVENRLSTLYSLMQKFRVQTVRELLELHQQFSEQLMQIESYDEAIQEQQQKVDSIHADMQEQAILLSSQRKSYITHIEEYMVEKLSYLGMPNIQFKVDIQSVEHYTDKGLDAVRLLFSANKNREMQPVESIASGGEISRLMLTIKSLIAHKSDLPTIIFDEIDTGVSGEIAHRMSDIMIEMSKAMQVMVITHLPQIASKGQQHFKVYKDESGQQTETHIRPLTHDERIHEIASMLSGKETSEAALQNARELLR